MLHSRWVFSSALLLALSGQPVSAHGGQPAAEAILVYPTYGFRAGTGWVIPARAKVQTARITPELLIDTFLTSLFVSDSRERTNYRTRIADILADDRSDKEIAVTFDGDAAGQVHRIADGRGRPLRTDANGIVEGTIRIDDAAARRLLERQGSSGGWLSYRAEADGHSGQGRVRLLEPEGLSVISDIDDTIKVSEVPAGKAILARNTFLRDFVAAPGMQPRYEALSGAAFHYVSGSPWQLHRPLSRFLIDETRFPAGSFHFKELRGHALTAMRSLEDLANFANPEGTVAHKVEQISAIMKRFPGRTFILIGDSGERDPEVYRQILAAFGPQVREVLIRDVVNARQIDRGRLAGMTVIEAPTVMPGVSMLK